MTLVFVAEQLVGIDRLEASMTPAPGFSTGEWHYGRGDLGASDFAVSTGIDPIAPHLELTTDGAAHVQYEISYSSPLLGWFHLTSEDGGYAFSGSGPPDHGDGLWRIDFAAEWSTCSGHNPASTECYAIGRWVDEAAAAAVQTPEPAGLFVAMLAVALAGRLKCFAAGHAGAVLGRPAMASARPLARKAP